MLLFLINEIYIFLEFSFIASIIEYVQKIIVDIIAIVKITNIPNSVTPDLANINRNTKTINRANKIDFIISFKIYFIILPHLTDTTNIIFTSMLF